MFYINRLYQPYNQLNIASISEMMKQGEKQQWEHAVFTKPG